MPVLSAWEVRDSSSIDVMLDPRWAVQSMFGGALAAVAVRAARETLGTELTLSDALFEFLAPTPPASITISVQPTRTGRRFAGAEVEIRCEGRETVRGTVAFSEGRMPPLGAEAAEPPASGSPAFGGDVEWHPGGDSRPGAFESWVRSTGPHFASDEWLCVAADIAAPAIAAPARTAFGRPFAVATATLAVTVLESAPPTDWMRQSTRARLQRRTVSALVDLRDPSGRMIARASQRAALLPADSDDPRLVTAFADSAINSHLFGMN